MLKKFRKIVWILCVSITLLVGSLIIAFVPQKPKDITSVLNKEYVYVSLGDSIAYGIGLPNDNSKNQWGFVDNCYADLLRNELNNNVANLVAINHAVSGQTSTELLNLLNNDSIIISNVKRADVITICIGANDILGPATNGLLNFVKDDQDITPGLDSGLKIFSTNFPKILNRVRDLNRGAKVVFLNVYNPYKEFISTEQNITLEIPYFANFDISHEKLNAIGNITETYLDSGTVSDATISSGTKTIQNGINQIIKNTIKDELFCYLLDVKAQFDDYFKTNEEYSIVNVDLLENLTISYSDLWNSIDPHPSQSGHIKIFELFTVELIEKLTTKINYFI